MLTEINLTSLVSIDKNFDDKKELEKIILIKVPTETYPTLYETFVYLFAQAGIKNISIEKKLILKKCITKKINLNRNNFYLIGILDSFYVVSIPQCLA